MYPNLSRNNRIPTEVKSLLNSPNQHFRVISFFIGSSESRQVSTTSDYFTETRQFMMVGHIRWLGCNT